MDQSSTTGLRKRQQISRANRVMFLWIAGVSVVVGVSLVLIVFLVQKIVFGERVISEKNKTVSVLQKNLSTVDKLKDNIRVLDTNEALNSTKLNDSDSALQSVLDALPANSNSTALASSLQTKLLAGVPGVGIDTINVDAVNDDEGDSNEIGFTFSVSTDTSTYGSLQQVLEKIEKSIRPFNITSLSVESQGSKVVLTASGVSYYNAAQSLDLSTKVVKQ